MKSHFKGMRVSGLPQKKENPVSKSSKANKKAAMGKHNPQKGGGNKLGLPAAYGAKLPKMKSR